MPAPYRYLFALPGNSLADVQASSDLADWVDLPDREAEMVTLSELSGGPGQSSVVYLDQTEVRDDPPIPVDPFPDDAIELSQSISAHPGLPGASADDFPAQFWVHHSTWTLQTARPGDDDPTSHVHVLDGGRYGSASTAVASSADMYFSPSWMTLTPPDGAIGYEVEQHQVEDGQWLAIADPVSLSLTVTHSTARANGGGTFFAISGVDGNWGSGPIEWLPTGLTVGALADQSITFAQDVQEARVEKPVEGTGTQPSVETFGPMTVDLASVFSPPRTGLVALRQVITGTLLEMTDGTTFTAGSNVSWQGTYTIRPPRIRWIYGDVVPPPVVLPPAVRRTYPRDDGLAGGSAPRTWPPSKAVQSSNRTFGGYL